MVRSLVQAGIAAEAIHGNKSQGQRERVLAAFRNGEVRTLVATDIAARGIDVDGISHVVNFDLPNVPETYVHRIGRTARAGAAGIAISLCDGEEMAFLRDIEKLIRMSIPLSDRRADPRRLRAGHRQTHATAARPPSPWQGTGIGTAAMSPQARAAVTNRARPAGASAGAGGIDAVAFLHRNGAAAARPRSSARRVGPASRKDHDVAKEELLEFEGLVTEILPDARYRVQLDNGHALVAYTAGRMKKNRIKTLAGDRVTVEVSPYDLEKGRLIFRHKDERAGSMSRAAATQPIPPAVMHGQR